MPNADSEIEDEAFWKVVTDVNGNVDDQETDKVVTIQPQIYVLKPGVNQTTSELSLLTSPTASGDLIRSTIGTACLTVNPLRMQKSKSRVQLLMMLRNHQAHYQISKSTRKRQICD